MTNTSYIDDQSLISSVLARDRRALLLLYRRFTPKLKKHIQNKVACVADCDEILQDTLYAFLESLRDFHGQSSIQTFLYAICSHKIIDYYRRKKLKQIVFSRMPNLEALVSPMFNPEQELDTVVLKEKIHMVLAQLVPGYLRLIVLKYMDDLSVREIAKKLAVSIKSAESQLFRARKAFIQLFISI